MKRYFIADIIGDGSDTNEYRASVAVYPVNWAAEVPWDDIENRPINNWTVAEVSGGDMSGFAGDTRIDPLPIDGFVPICWTYREKMIDQVNPTSYIGPRNFS
jgi:hypothetical protein